MNLRLAGQADELLARRGYRIVYAATGDEREGWHALWSADHGDPGARVSCLGMVPPHLLDTLPGLLERAGWPTRPVNGWVCPHHGPVKEEC